jgi:hypothetical protein
MEAFMHDEDGARWLRIKTDTAEWDEPIAGWTIVHDLTRGGPATWRHTDGRELRDA